MMSVTETVAAAVVLGQKLSNEMTMREEFAMRFLAAQLSPESPVTTRFSAQNAVRAADELLRALAAT